MSNSALITRVWNGRIGVGVWLLLCFSLAQSFGAGVLRVSKTNPRYFTDDSGRAIYLSGYHTWNNFQEFSAVPSLDYAAYVGSLQSLGCNFIRLWNVNTMRVGYFSCPDPVLGWGYLSPLAFVRTGPGLAHDGHLKFDLTRLNQAYFDRMSNRIAQAQAAGLYVCLQAFDFLPDVSYTNFHWSPFNSANNIHGTLSSAPDLFTFKDAFMMGVYTNYLHKLVETVNPFDNLLYETGNEPQLYMSNFVAWVIDVIHEYEAAKPKQHPVVYGSYTADGNAIQAANRTAEAITPSGHDPDYRIPKLYADTRPVILDSDHIWLPSRGGYEYIWAGFTRGYNHSHMDSGNIYCPDIGFALPDPKTRQALGDTVRFANRMDLIHMRPSVTASSTAFALVNRGKEYLIWQPLAGSFTVDMAGGTYLYEWFRPATSSTVERGMIQLDNGLNSFQAPFPEPAVLYLKSASGRPGQSSLEPASALTGAYVFYNNSAWDDCGSDAVESDCKAMAPDKKPLFRGQTATISNYTSYSRGLNGIIIDISALPGTPTAADFTFRIGNDHWPITWPEAPAPDRVRVVPGAGRQRSDRLVLTWPDNAVEQGWLEVTVLPTARTGLAAPSTFYFGSAIGESGDSARHAEVNSTDVLLTRHSPRTAANPAPIDFPFDYNRDRRVDSVDVAIALLHQARGSASLQLIDLSNRAGSRVDEAPSYELVYSLEIPDEADFNASGVPYTIDQHAQIGPFSRVAYYLELQPETGPDQFLWVSMDAFTDDVRKLGVPTRSSGAFFQQRVTNMNVRSSVAGILSGDGLPGGVLEFWPGNYHPRGGTGLAGAHDEVYDFDDSSDRADVGYGSMQVHDSLKRQTLFAFNGWGAAPGLCVDLGIGNYSGPHPDWTFAQNSFGYTAKTLQVYVLLAD